MHKITREEWRQECVGSYEYQLWMINELHRTGYRFRSLANEVWIFGKDLEYDTADINIILATADPYDIQIGDFLFFNHNFPILIMPSRWNWPEILTFLGLATSKAQVRKMENFRGPKMFAPRGYSELEFGKLKRTFTLLKPSGLTYGPLVSLEKLFEA